MELKIVNRTASSFHEAVGISEERSDILADQMDEIIKKYKQAGGTAYACEVFNDITKLCANLEELVYCVIAHTNYHSVTTGFVLCPPKKKK